MNQAPTASAGHSAILSVRLGALSVALSDALGAVLPEGLRDGPDAAALNTVFQWPGERVDGLSHILGLSHSGTVRAVDRLEKAGLIRRETHATDRRAVALFPTEAGRALAERLQRDRMAVLTALIARLGQEETAALAAAVEALLVALAPTREAANRICRLCEERICRPEICPTERGVRVVKDDPKPGF